MNKLILSFFCLCLSFATAFAEEKHDVIQAETEDASAAKELFPEALISPGEGDDYTILVEKASQKLHIYDNNYNRIKTVIVTTGQNRGNKMQIGDRKTPEGVYFFKDIMEDRELFPEYGVMALSTDYPNPVDRANNKNGSGIWLHATNQPERPLTAFDTRGCVVAVNEDVLDVARYVGLESTPFVIVEKLDYAPPSKIYKERSDIVEFLGKWEESWEKKDIGRYISAYSSRFRSRGMGVRDWKRYKEGLNRRYDLISVEIENPRITKSSGYVVVAFTQKYQSDRFTDVGIKRLYLNKEEYGWKIVGEEWSAIPAENPKEIANSYLQRIAFKKGDKKVSDN